MDFFPDSSTHRDNARRAAFNDAGTCRDAHLDHDGAAKVFTVGLMFIRC
jgi:hypothetical protein